jgi:hypothetical protein
LGVGLRDCRDEIVEATTNGPFGAHFGFESITTSSQPPDGS